MISEPSAIFGSAQATPRRSSASSWSGDVPASLINISKVIPKWARIVPRSGRQPRLSPGFAGSYEASVPCRRRNQNGDRNAEIPLFNNLGQHSMPVERNCAARCPRRYFDSPRRIIIDRWFPAQSLMAQVAHSASGGVQRGLRSPPVSRSIAERTASTVLRSCNASSSGPVAPERRISVCGSGMMSGKSHGP